MQSEQKSYRNATLIAGSSFINVGLSIVRNKVFAIFLGPIGMGQFGILNDFINTIINFASLGISNSGVQAFSELNTKNPSQIGGYLRAFYRLFSFIIGICLLGLIVFARPISVFLFQDLSYASYIIIGSLAIGFKIFSTIQGSLINGLQKMRMLVLGNIYQGFFATVSGIALVWLLGPQSVPYLVLSIALTAWSVSFYYARKIRIQELIHSDFQPKFKKLQPYLILGIATMWGGLLESIVAVLSKSYIGRTFGGEYLGYYQVSIGFTATYISFITQALTKDYYPALVRTFNSAREKVNEFVNQQMRISIILLMPILLTVLSSSPFIIRLLYSKSFLPAVEVLDFTIMGTFVLVLCWPIAYVFVAGKRTKLYVVSETLGNFSMLSMNFIAIYLGTFYFLGVSYLIHYLLYFIVVLAIFFKFFQGNVELKTWGLIILNSCIIGVVAVSKLYLNEFQVLYIGGAALLVYTIIQRKAYINLLKSLGIWK